MSTPDSDPTVFYDAVAALKDPRARHGVVQNQQHDAAGDRCVLGDGVVPRYEKS